MPYSFNLIEQAWIPCVLPDGSRMEFSLRDTLLQAHEIRGVFDQSPLVTAALHRLLLTLSHRNFGPASQSDWKTLWQARRFDDHKLGVYFSDYYDRFDLFDETQPFYQVAGLEARSREVKEVEVNDLLPDLSRGNTATLFDHTTDSASPSLKPAEAARAILALQSYKLGGLFQPGSYSDAPVARAVYFLIEGDTLFETLLLNLVRYYGDYPIPVIDDDLPAWEQKEAGTSETPRGYLDYLTWQTVWLKLLPERTSIGDCEVRKVRLKIGRKFNPEPQMIFDPGCSYTKNPKAKENQEPWRHQRYRTGRALWRDSGPLFRRLSIQERPPSSLQWVADLVKSGFLSEEKPYRLIAYGQCTDQAKVFFWRTEHLPLLPQYLTDEDLGEVLEGALKRAEEVGKGLWQSVRRLACTVLYPFIDLQKLNKQQKDEVRRMVEHLGATETYWSGLEIPFLAFIRTLADDPDAALVDWNRLLEDSARQDFEAAAGHLDQSARVLRAVAKSRSHLDGLLGAALSKIQ